MLKVRMRYMLIAKNRLLFGLILFTNLIDATEDTKQIKIKNKLKNIVKLNSESNLLNSKFASLKCDKSLYPTSLPNALSRLENKSQISLSLSSQIKEEKIMSLREKIMSLSEKVIFLRKFDFSNYDKNKNSKINGIVNDLLNRKKLNKILPNGNTVLYEIFKNNTLFQYSGALINAFLDQNPNMTIQNRNGNTTFHKLLKAIYSIQAVKIVDFTKNSIQFFICNDIVNCLRDKYCNCNTQKYTFNINNVSQKLMIKNKRNETPLHYIFNTFHCMGVGRVTKRFKEEINKYNPGVGTENYVTAIASIIKEVDVYENKKQPKNTKEYYNQWSTRFTFEAFGSLFSNVFGHYESLSLYKTDPTFSLFIRRFERSGAYYHNGSYDYKEATIDNVKNELIYIKNYLDFKRQGLLIFFWSMKHSQSFKENIKIFNGYTLPQPLRKYISLKAIPNSDLLLIGSLNNIITKLENGNIITEDDFNRLKNAAQN